MARPDQEAIDTFISIAGVSEAVAIQKLEEHHGNLNEAVNAHFSEGPRNRAQAAFTNTHDDVMDIDNVTSGLSLRPPSSQHLLTGDLNPFSLHDPNFPTSIIDSGPNIASQPPFVSHPGNVREVPVEVKNNGDGASGQSGHAPAVIDNVSEAGHNHGSGIRGTVILDGADDARSTLNAPIVNLPDNSNDIEEEMVRAAIEASKQDTAMSSEGHDRLDLGNPAPPQPMQSQLEDTELAHAVSLSLQTAERENALREPKGIVSFSEPDAPMSSSPEETRKITSTNGRPPQLEHGSSSVPNESEDVEDMQLSRHRRRRVTSSSSDTPSDNGIEVCSNSSLQQNENVHNSQNNGSDFPSEWGGITSEEHDEAVMLEAAMFGGVPDRNEFRFPSVPSQLMQNNFDQSLSPFPRPAPRPPSPSLTAQRLIREQQDDEYLAALQADREKELKAKQEAEAALAEERLKEEEIRQQLQQQEEIEKQLVAKEVSLPQEPNPDDENAINLLVRMPDGSRRGRRFLKSDKLQHLFDYIDVGRVIKPGSYRLVRPYPRRAFGNDELSLTLNEVGLTSKQEALYLELI